MSRPRNPFAEPPVPLDPISEWRTWQALSIIYTVMLNRQIRRRWVLEHKCMEDRPLSERFRPVIFLEAVPTIHKPSSTTKNQINNPFNTSTMSKLRTKVEFLRARVEKGKELASQIERRMVQSPRIEYPTHFCHTCVESGEGVEVLLTKCGHRVCRTCLGYGIDEAGVYECSICFAPAEFVARNLLLMTKACLEKVSSTVSKGREIGMGIAKKKGEGSGRDVGLSPPIVNLR
ncbi:hypothetical protein VN97_g12852 [Penicillium thymicola]|uniref:RING-type domain-containing protein n=1 Tax=Penicillium thymicola TaxID=293382 RepID=A0AAI9X1W6_PENTH|nr:hypothetical protein VN97_g12852 [Penicillium thymicola]